MKISPIQIYKPSFGYNRQLNDELKARLASHPDKKWAKTLGQMNSFCNKLESDVKREDKTKNNPGSKFSDYLDIFLTYKQMLAGFIAITFNDLKYADKEYETYADEYIKEGAKEYDWRRDVCEQLTEWTEENHRPLTDANPVEVTYVITNPQEDEMAEELPECIDSPKTLSDKKADIIDTLKSHLGSNSMLEEFRPAEFSPKGFQDVAGMDKLKKDLKSSIVDVINNPEQA